MFQKILCPIDFSSSACEALKTALTLATNGTTEVCLLYVSEPMVALGHFLPNIESEAKHISKSIIRLCEIVEEYVPPTVQARPILKYGYATQEILKVADQESADLIVLSPQGAGGTQTGNLGQVAQYVLRMAPCPVLTVSDSSNCFYRG